MQFSKILGSALVFSAVSLGSTAAFADYVCNSVYFPVTGTLGNEGYVYASYYSAPNCGGSLLYTRFYCTGTATNTLCSATYRYERAGLLEMYAGLKYAASVDQLVTGSASGCIGGGTGCGGQVYFQSN
jgi:hypothetical protein